MRSAWLSAVSIDALVMAMTPPQMAAFHQEQAERNRHNAQQFAQQGNLHVFRLNVEEGFRNRLMQGLISWRIELASPRPIFVTAIEELQLGITELRALTDGSIRPASLTQASFLCQLVDMDSAPFQGPLGEADVLLDHVLVQRFSGGFDEALWKQGMAELQKLKRTQLAVETYNVYRRLFEVELGEREALVTAACDLFKRRAKDSFYHPVDVAGGGPDNKFTVDFVLSAIMKHLGVPAENMHRWRW